jgi:hypothetical protein
MNKTSKYRNIQTGDPNHCLDVFRGAKQSNAPVISYKCHKGTNQQMFYNKKTKQIRVKHSKKCLDISKGQVVQKKCNTRKLSQKWNYKNKHWRSLKNKKCMDVMGGHYNNGVIITHPCHKGDNQQFHQ